MGVLGTLKHAFNVFVNQPAPQDFLRGGGYGASYGSRPDRTRLIITNERTIIASIYTRLGIDVASAELRHVRLDDNDRFKEEIDSGLNQCLTVEANLDQAATAFLLDIAMSLFECGVIAVVPIDTTVNPELGSYDIQSLRVGKIVQWYPEHVRVDVYNEKTSRREEILIRKRNCAIIENPLFTVMNEPNSTLQRLVGKLSLLDKADVESSAGKLDLIIQLPYTVKSETMRQRAEQRRQDIEFQLKGSKYGIAYADGTEKITQLNRPVENNLLEQIRDLKMQLYSELGLTPEVMAGTADEATMRNYDARTIQPILTAIVEEMRRKFLTKTARTQKQSILFWRDVFKLVPIKDLAEIVDKFARNEVLSSNEVRGIIGFKPDSNPKSDQLINSNMPVSDTGVTNPNATDPNAVTTTTPTDTGGLDDSMLSALEKSVNDALAVVGE